MSRGTNLTWFAIGLILTAAAAGMAAQQVGDSTSAEPLATELRAIVPAGRSAVVIDSAGIARSGRRMVSLETTEPLEISRRRLAIVGGVDGDPRSTRMVLAFLKWWFQDRGAATLRQRWQVVAVPCALPDACGSTDQRAAGGAPSSAKPAGTGLLFPPVDGFYGAADARESRYLWRWASLQGLDVLIEVRAGARVEWWLNRPAQGLLPASQIPDATSLVGALGENQPSSLAPVPAALLSAPADRATDSLSQFLQSSARTLQQPSALRQMVAARTARRPLDVARLLAGKYPANKAITYVPSVSWAGMLRLGTLTGESQWRERVRREMVPLLGTRKPAPPGPVNMSDVSGHAPLYDLSVLENDRELEAVTTRAADSMVPQSPETIERFRTEDMFMAPFMLSRVAVRTGDDRYASALGRFLIASAQKLQREDGLFIHATGSPIAWGRGNGFAVLGLSEALVRLPASWSARSALLDIFRRQIRALVRWQAPDGMWREIVDEPGSYRELTVTTMTIAAMARGLRQGWLDREFRPIVDRAWNGVLARIGEDAALLDPCISTGAGPDKQYYLDRAAVIGMDDRGGGMALIAALEMAELTGSSR